MKKILIYNHTFFNRSETFIYNQVKALEKNNHLLLVGHHIDLTDNFQLNGLTKTYTIPSIPLTFNERLLHYIKRNVSGLYNRLSPKAEKELDLIISKEKVDIIHAHFGTSAIRVLPIAIKLKIPLVVSFHGYDASRMLRDKRYTTQLKKLFAYANKSILCAPFMFDNLKEYGLKRERMAVIPYGVDLSKIKSIEKGSREKQNTFTIIHAGRIAAKKGVVDLVKVFIDIKKKKPELNIQLNIIGDGEEMDKVKTIIENNDEYKQHIKLFGGLPQRELLGHLKSADLFVLNSRTDDFNNMEGFPNAILEAMACKVPVISTNHAGIPNVVKNEKTGLLVEEKDNLALEKAILRMIEEEVLRKTVVQKAYDCIVEKFTLEKMNQSLKDVF